MNPGRRLALGLAGAMGAAAIGAELAKPRPGPSVPDAPPLDQLVPRSFGDWRVRESGELMIRPTSGRGRVLDIYSQVLERTYVGRHGGRIMLLAAEGAEQSAKLQLHYPEDCYPANGFTVEDVHQVILQAGGHRLPATQMWARMPGRSEPITYWVVLGGEVVADDGTYRWRRLAFGLRRRLLTGMLVRVSSIDPEPQRAYETHARFAAQLVAALPRAAVGRLIGA